MKHVMVFLALSALFSCTGGSSNDNPSTSKAIDEVKTKEIFEHHGKAFWEGDLEAVMADYAEESILITPDGTYAGTTEIRNFFQGALKNFPKDSTTSQTIKTVIKNDVAYVIWNCKTPKFELSYATDSFIIQNGKIIRQTFAGH